MDVSRAASFISFVSSVQVMKEKHLILSCLLIVIVIVKSTSYTYFLATQQNQLRNVCTVKLMPEMKSGTPKTYTLIPYTGQLNNSVRRLMNWYCVCWHHPGIYNREFQNRDKFQEKCYCNNWGLQNYAFCVKYSLIPLRNKHGF